MRRVATGAHRRNQSIRTGGFTVLELVIAMAVLGVILAATTGLLRTSYRANQVNEDASSRQQEIEAAVKILSYDLSLAGYRGTTEGAFSANTFTAPTLEVVRRGASDGINDRIIVRYFEDSERLYGATDTCGSPCTVLYDVGVDDEGVRLLYRRELNADEVGIVQEVESFQVLQFIRRTGPPVDVSAAASGTSVPVPADLAALNIEIRFTDGGVWRFPVGVTNPQASSS